MTPDGDVAIENLRIGDMVMTLYEGKRIPKSIVWIGSREIKANQYNNKENQYPVRIKAHTLGINQPYRDLLITPEHTIYINNKLTPVRMLMNNRSIVIDRF